MPTENTNEQITESPTPPLPVETLAPTLESVSAESAVPKEPSDAKALEGKSETVPPTVLPEEPKIPPTPFDKGGVINDLLQKAKEKIQFRKRAKLEKIMAQAQSQGKISNNDVEKLLRCSDATATRYLAELTKQGRLKRVGAGPALVYEFLR